MRDRVALVTGGSSGIGAATAIAFARAGAKVAIASRDKLRAEHTVDTITSAGGEAKWIAADVCDAHQVERLVEQTLDHYGRLDHAFNSAGGGGPNGLTADITEDGWNQTIHSYLTSVWLCMKYELK